MGGGGREAGGWGPAEAVGHARTLSTCCPGRPAKLIMESYHLGPTRLGQGCAGCRDIAVLSLANLCLRKSYKSGHSRAGLRMQTSCLPGNEDSGYDVGGYGEALLARGTV